MVSVQMLALNSFLQKLTSNDLYSKEDLEKIAIEFLSPEIKKNMEFLYVFHPPKDIDLDPSMNYRINLES